MRAVIGSIFRNMTVPTTERTCIYNRLPNVSGQSMGYRFNSLSLTARTYLWRILQHLFAIRTLHRVFPCYFEMTIYMYWMIGCRSGGLMIVAEASKTVSLTLLKEVEKHHAHLPTSSQMSYLKIEWMKMYPSWYGLSHLHSKREIISTIAVRYREGITI